jgi:hypothetical protein
VAVITATLCLVTDAPAVVLLSDGFNYPNGPLVGAVGSPWAAHSSPGTNSVTVTNGQVRLAFFGGEDVNAALAGQSFAPTSGVALYTSFRLTLTSLPLAGGEYFAHFKNSGSQFTARIWASTTNAPAGMFRLGIANASGSTNTQLATNLSLNTPYTVVSRYVVSNGFSTLWINPASESDPGATAADPVSLITVTAYALRQASGGGSILLDDLIVGTSFDEVMPRPPAATTLVPRDLSAAGATFQGMAVGNGPGTTAWFEWGVDRTYGQATAPLAVNPDTNITFVSQPVTLGTNLSYHYRLVVSNAAGVARGADQIFAVAPVTHAWNFNSRGQTDVTAGLSNVVAIAGGSDLSLALRSDGRVVAWGDNFHGQTNVPAGLSNVVAIAGGGYHSLALRSDGRVVAWGDNFYGQTNVPAGLSNVVAIAGGGYHSLALRSDGRVVAWGFNGQGQTNIPIGLSNVVAIAGGNYHSLALRSDGRVVAWGYNFYGQTNVPAGLSNVVAIAGGFYHSLALRSDGQVVAWGYNSSGQTNVPAGLSNVVAIAGGGFHNLALRSDGRVVAWGYNSYGQTNVPSGLGSAVAIAGGERHSISIVSGPPSGTLQFGSSSTRCRENEGSVIVRIFREGAASGSVSVNYATADRTAVAGQDYASTSGIAEFNDGQTAANIVIPILADANFELEESFDVLLTNPTGGAVLGVRSNTSVEILEGQAFFSLGTPAFTANEAGGVAVITGTRSVFYGIGAVAVDIITLPGSALPGVDFVAVTNRLTWDDGETGTKSAVIPLLDNGLLDGTRAFTVAASSPSPGVTLVDPTNAIVTIVDDDSPPTVQWETPAYTVNESGGSILMTAWRSGGPTNVQVNFATSNLSAVAGSDYVATNGTLTFAPSEISKTVSVRILDDFPVEGSESFVVRLLSVGDTLVGLNSNAIVTILDPANSPEDLYGHGLRIVGNYNYYFPSNTSFSNTLTIFNPSAGPSRTGLVALTETVGTTSLTGASNNYALPSIPGGGYFDLDVGGLFWSVNAGDFKTYNIYASVHEVSATNGSVLQPQHTRLIWQFVGTAPPSGGVPIGGDGLGAPGFNPPPYVTNVVILGTNRVEEGTFADYTAMALLSNGTTNTAVTPVWTNSPFLLSAAGRFTPGGVTADTRTVVTGVVTYGATVMGTSSVLVVDVREPSFGPPSLAGKKATLQLQGTTGRRYAIEANTNLAFPSNWTVLATNQILSNSLSPFVDPSAGTNTQRFYRARQVP